jgi:hypothetical protein
MKGNTRRYTDLVTSGSRRRLLWGDKGGAFYFLVTRDRVADGQGWMDTMGLNKISRYQDVDCEDTI